MSTKRILLGALTLAFAVLFQLQATQAVAKTEPVRARLISLAAIKGGDCAAPQEVCCPKPCITYRHRGPKLCCGTCEPSVETVLKVKDPCTCCDVDVAVCLPDFSPSPYTAVAGPRSSDSNHPRPSRASGGNRNRRTK